LSIHDAEQAEHGNYVIRNGQLRNNTSNLKAPIRYIMDLEKIKQEEELTEIVPLKGTLNDPNTLKKSISNGKGMLSKLLSRQGLKKESYF